MNSKLIASDISEEFQFEINPLTENTRNSLNFFLK